MEAVAGALVRNCGDHRSMTSDGVTALLSPGIQDVEDSSISSPGNNKSITLPAGDVIDLSVLRIRCRKYLLGYGYLEATEL